MFEYTERELQIVNHISTRFKLYWRDDAKNIALEAIWRLRDQYNPEIGEYYGWLYSKVYFHCIDEHRKEIGRKGQKKWKAITEAVEVINNAHTPSDYDMSRQVVEYTTPETIVIDLDGNLSHLVNDLTKRELEIAKMLVGGMTQQDVADVMGLHPSRICQIMKPVKEKIRLGMMA